METVGRKEPGRNICRTCGATGVILAVSIKGKYVWLEPVPTETRAPKLRGRPRGGWVLQSDLAGGFPRAFRVETPTTLRKHECRSFSSVQTTSERKASTRPVSR